MIFLFFHLFPFFICSHFQGVLSSEIGEEMAVALLVLLPISPYSDSDEVSLLDFFPFSILATLCSSLFLLSWRLPLFFKYTILINALLFKDQVLFIFSKTHFLTLKSLYFLPLKYTILAQQTLHLPLLVLLPLIFHEPLHHHNHKLDFIGLVIHFRHQ